MRETKHWRQPYPSVLVCAVAGLAVWLVSPIVRAENAYSVAWAQQLGSANFEHAASFAADWRGNVVFSGAASGSFAGPANGDRDVWLGLYDTAGNPFWMDQLGSSRADSTQGTVTDNFGNIFISGTTSGNLAIPKIGISDAFVARYESNGDLAWVRQFGLEGKGVSGEGLAIDGTGNLFVGGSTNGSLGGANAGLGDAYVTKYDAYGEQLWVRQLGSSTWDYGRGVAADIVGNSYLAGYTDGVLAGSTSAGGRDAFVTKYDSSGNLAWTRQFGTSAEDSAYNVATDLLGNVFVTGWTKGALGGPHFGNGDIFVRKYDTDGNVVWTRQFGSGSADWGAEITVDLLGNVFITGTTEGRIGASFAGATDGFVSKLDPNGVVLWTRQFGTSTWENSNAVISDMYGNVYIGGSTQGDLFAENEGSTDIFILKLTAPSFTTLPGDANNDGVVNEMDFAMVEQRLGLIGVASGLLPGDANDDGRVDGEDWLFVERHFGDTLSAAPGLPEPGASSLFIVSLAASLWLRRPR